MKVRQYIKTQLLTYLLTELDAYRRVNISPHTNVTQYISTNVSAGSICTLQSSTHTGYWTEQLVASDKRR